MKIDGEICHIQPCEYILASIKYHNEVVLFIYNSFSG
jgi:hypothetical protein